LVMAPPPPRPLPLHTTSSRTPLLHTANHRQFFQHTHTHTHTNTHTHTVQVTRAGCGTACSASTPPTS
jgi:hypothetical protein